MEDILRQLGELLLAAIPTVVVFVILFVAYRLIVHNRLVAVLGERRALTEGAVEKAKADIAAAAARTAEYEQRLRDARLSIFKRLEGSRQQLLQARAVAVAEARAAADARVKAARTSLQQDVESAKVTLQAESETLASQVIRTVLKPAMAAGVTVAGGRPS
jgi:F-type H+-transporting ATPase subunit b